MGRLGREPALAGEPLRRLRAGLDGPGRSPVCCLGSDAHVAWAPVAGFGRNCASVGIVLRSGRCYGRCHVPVGKARNRECVQHQQVLRPRNNA